MRTKPPQPQILVQPEKALSAWAVVNFKAPSAESGAG
jgi:hypothetical protein